MALTRHEPTGASFSLGGFHIDFRDKGTPQRSVTQIWAAIITNLVANPTQPTPTPTAYQSEVDLPPTPIRSNQIDTWAAAAEVARWWESGEDEVAHVGQPPVLLTSGLFIIWIPPPHHQTSLFFHVIQL